MNKRNQLATWLAVLLVAVLWPNAAVADPPTFTVNTTSDLPYPSGGFLTLREAVDKANKYEGDGVPVINFAITGTIALSPGSIELELRNSIFLVRSMTIHGPGARRLTISGGGYTRIFYIQNSGPLLDCDIRGLTFSQGAGSYHSSPGGAIESYDANLSLIDCELSDNYSPSAGGALDLVVGQGGCYLSGCTFTGNRAQNVGGAVSSTSGFGNATSIANCTFCGNTAGAGGAIFASSGTGLVLKSCTITANTASPSAPQVSNQGGGVCIWFDAGRVSFQDTIVAGNSALDGPDIETQLFISAHVVSLGYNFIGQTNGSYGPGGGSNPWLASDTVGSAANPKLPMLGPLQYNGGQTRTCMPQMVSPATVIDQGYSDLAVDQRGWGRLFDVAAINNAAGGNGVDIGAVEYGSPHPPFIPSTEPPILNLPICVPCTNQYNVAPSIVPLEAALTTGISGGSTARTFSAPPTKFITLPM